jgi:large conductance mechanosensitive channel
VYNLRTIPPLFMLKEFKAFAMRGNVMDMAVGIIIGAAFGKIVSSFVGDVLMPIIGSLTGGVDFSSLSVTVGDAVVNYGLFIQSIVDFVIVAFSIFIVIRQMNKMKKKQDDGAKDAPPPPREQVLLEEIRDLLKK